MTDAWIFLSVGDAVGSGGHAAPRDVIWMADANFHARPSWDVIEGSVSRLIAAGLVDDADLLRLSDEGKKRYDATWAPGLGHIERVLELGKMWEIEDYPPPAPRSWSVPPDLR
jgi:hypothetical protein